MTLKTYELLEFDKIKEAVAQQSVSAMTRTEILKAQPSFTLAEIKNELALTEEASLLLNKYLLNPLAAIDCIDEILEKASVGSTLSMGELLKVARVLRSARIAKATVESAPEDIRLLRELVAGISVDRTLENSITQSIVSENEMSDKASDKLYGLRRKISTLNVKLKEKLAGYTRNNNSSKYLQDNLVTVREGRYVLPVKSECRGEVAGLVHDRSATGSTVYIEPFAVVELNNELRIAIAEEQAEVERILSEFTVKVATFSESLFVSQTIVIRIDEVFCKAKYSTKIRGVMPQFNAKKEVKLIAARHPLIDQDKIVPVDIVLGGSYRVLLITGPNTGGKTVSLKTIGLLCLMAYFGLYLPCVSADVCLFDNIFCDIGDDQSIENELSTFSSHIKSLIHITQSISEKSLVLLDEVGGGTDPEEGAALAIGIVSKLLSTGCLGMLTTHYGQLKEYAMATDYIENACMQFNEQTLAPTFKLIIGMPGTSNALKIAKRLGLSHDIISVAKDNLSEEKIRIEKVLQNAEQIKRESLDELERTRAIKNECLLEKSELELKRKQLDQQLEKIKLNATAETKRLVSSAVERANEIIDEMKAISARASESALLDAKKLRHRLEDIDLELNSEKFAVSGEKLNPQEITVGTSVIVATLGAEGKILSVNSKRKEAEIAVGTAKINARFSDLCKPFAKTAERKTQTKKSTLARGERASSGFTEREIMVLGMTVNEAIEEIEPLLLSMFSEDDAKILRIVHGKGTGALGRGIQLYLKSSALVSEYRYGRYGEGDNGVTIVTVK